MAWRDERSPLLFSSFRPEALQAAREAGVGLPVARVHGVHRGGAIADVKQIKDAVHDALLQHEELGLQAFGLGLADEAFEGVGEAIYRDPRQPAVVSAAAIPSSLAVFARQVVDKALQNPDLLDSLLGEYLTEPKANVWFEDAEVSPDLSMGLRLDRRSKMMYDDKHVFINGEGFKVGGRDAVVLRQLADERVITVQKIKVLSADAKEALLDWASAGWLKSL